MVQMTMTIRTKHIALIDLALESRCGPVRDGVRYIYILFARIAVMKVQYVISLFTAILTPATPRLSDQLFVPVPTSAVRLFSVHASTCVTG